MRVVLPTVGAHRFVLEPLSQGRKMPPKKRPPTDYGVEDPSAAEQPTNNTSAQNLLLTATDTSGEVENSAEGEFEVALLEVGVSAADIDAFRRIQKQMDEALQVDQAHDPPRAARPSTEAQRRGKGPQDPQSSLQSEEDLCQEALRRQIENNRRQLKTLQQA